MTDRERVIRMQRLAQQNADRLKRQAELERERFKQEVKAFSEAMEDVYLMEGLPVETGGGSSPLRVSTWGVGSTENKAFGLTGTVFDRGTDCDVFRVTWDWTSGETVCRVVTCCTDPDDAGPDGLGPVCTPQEAARRCVYAVEVELAIPEDLRREITDDYRPQAPGKAADVQG
jgi:hypothetical protein